LIILSNSNLKQCISSVQPLFQLFSQPLDKSNITLENITNSLSLFPVDSTGSNLKDLDLVQTQLEILFNMLQYLSSVLSSIQALLKEKEINLDIITLTEMLSKLISAFVETLKILTIPNFNIACTASNERFFWL